MYDGNEEVLRQRRDMRPELRPVAALEMIADQMAGLREELRQIRLLLEKRVDGNAARRFRRKAG